MAQTQERPAAFDALLLVVALVDRFLFALAATGADCLAVRRVGGHRWDLQRNHLL
jgi:hypothetical protein